MFPASDQRRSDGSNQQEAVSPLRSSNVCVCGSGCLGEWDNVSCCQRAAVEEVLTLPGPPLLVSLFGNNGNLSRTCTETGWSDVSPPSITCWFNSTDEPSELVFYTVVKILSTLGHSLTFITLLTSTVIICLYRKLHCTRNYVHLNLFLSFMLRAAAVLSKDTLLFSGEQNAECSAQPSLVVLVFFNYFVMATFLAAVEGLYLTRWCWFPQLLHPPLLYLLINVKVLQMCPGVLVLVCWLTLSHLTSASVSQINFVLFVSIIRILVQKLRCPDVGGNEQSQYRRLAKSTLLLIPLFGINYVLFVYLMEPADTNLRHVKIFFELALSSFQVARRARCVCTLNDTDTEVQTELRRTWRSLCLRRYLGRDYRTHAMSVSRNGNDSSAHSARSSRAVPQTETSVL
uniref:Vasoactive intestinal peptide receptor 2 n=1 Tax=Gasterosteus aculeatus aculeatus TaxID=481459 RepID=G3NAQ2_GASAC